MTTWVAVATVACIHAAAFSQITDLIADQPIAFSFLSLPLLPAYTDLTIVAALFEDGTKWERNLPPPMFTEAEKKAALEAQH